MMPHIVLKPVGSTYGATVGASSLALSDLVTIPTNALVAYIQAESADIRYKTDGGTPAGGVGGGMLLLAGTDVVIEGWDAIARLKMIRDASTSAVINVQFSGEGQP